jgi:hypothetical protein
MRISPDKERSCRRADSSRCSRSCCGTNTESRYEVFGTMHTPIGGTG